MTARVREWRQSEWRRAGVARFERPGDFWACNGLWPDPARRRMRRAPGWSAHVPWPAGFGRPAGLFYDRPNGYFAWVGLDPADDHVATCFYTAGWEHVATCDLGLASPLYGALTGLSQRNLCHWGGRLYLISGAAAVYAGDPTSGPLALLWSGTGGEGARLLCPYADRLLLVTSSGRVLRLNAAGDAFEPYYTPAAPLDVRYACPFRQAILLVARTHGGHLALLRLADAPPATLHQVAQFEGVSGNEPSAAPFTDGCLFAVHEGRLYFTSGWYEGMGALDVWAFDGSNIARAAQLADLPQRAEVRAAGLLNWRGELLFALVRRTQTAHALKLLVGEAFVDFCPAPFTPSDYACFYTLAGALATPARCGNSEGFIHTAGLQDGYVETSRLDMGYPGRVKRLDRLTALLSGADAGFSVTLQYRTDDTSAWTTATRASGTRRVQADPSSTYFYTLQVRVALEDTRGADLDYALDELAITYTVDE